MEISMVKYDEHGNVRDVALGDYKPADVQMFKDGGYVPVDKQEAERLSGKIEKPPWER